jgi:hypothetical protein
VAGWWLWYMFSPAVGRPNVCVHGWNSFVMSWRGPDIWCPNQISRDTGTQLLTVHKIGLRGIAKYVCVCVCVCVYNICTHTHTQLLHVYHLIKFSFADIRIVLSYCTIMYSFWIFVSDG